MNNEKSGDALEALRKRIDGIDGSISLLFRERMRLCADIAAYKRLNSLPIENREREAAVIAALEDGENGFKAETARLFGAIFDISKAMQRSMLNLYLVGMPNAGKSRLGRRIAKRLGRQFIDTDKSVMLKSGKSIDRIFSESGEDGFRRLEHEALLDAAAAGSAVVATGGGILTFTANAGIMHGSGMVVFLDRAPERLLGANVRNRPLLRGEGEGADGDIIVKLRAERLDTYLAAADMTVDPDRRSAEAFIVKRFEAFTRGAGFRGPSGRR